MKKYSLNNQIEKVLMGKATNFLNPIDTRYVINRLKSMDFDYKIFYLYKESEKLIVYNDDADITLFEIESKTLLTHSKILGSLFSHNLDDSMFGDIIITNDKYYIAVVNKLKSYFINNFNMVGKNKIKLHEVSLDQVRDFTPKYKELKISISSLRIDNVISKVIPTSRTISKELIDDDKIFINYEILNNRNYSLKENDIFSIRGVGKFKLVNIGALTKNNKYQIVIKKYI